MAREQSEIADGVLASTSVVDDPTILFLPPDPHLIKGKKAGTIAEYIFIYI
jgi:hypothetical protein